MNTRTRTLPNRNIESDHCTGFAWNTRWHDLWISNEDIIARPCTHVLRCILCLTRDRIRLWEMYIAQILLHRSISVATPQPFATEWILFEGDDKTGLVQTNPQTPIAQLPSEWQRLSASCRVATEVRHLPCSEVTHQHSHVTISTENRKHQRFDYKARSNTCCKSNCPWFSHRGLCQSYRDKR